ncbi:hypothetical protein FBUS_03307 [Fasciolopsis buskii]|uniref:Uncharacterized protein n=1 Tax=Fasciolopsis buskii TaxID=27845 RepID=A0A8E0VQJ6_9TREM|nr:hypothetical protein FBUS_03307 [Fasciolopsis buski]
MSKLNNSVFERARDKHGPRNRQLQVESFSNHGNLANDIQDTKAIVDSGRGTGHAIGSAAEEDDGELDEIHLTSKTTTTTTQTTAATTTGTKGTTRTFPAPLPCECVIPGVVFDGSPNDTSRETSMRSLAKRTLHIGLPGLQPASHKALFLFSEENAIRKYSKIIIEWGYPFHNLSHLLCV